jgi:uncharacterized damage-inducible protein DinB
MEEQLMKDISDGITGSLTHLTPMKAIEGLTPEIARKKPSDKLHSCWDLLHHTVFWQEVLLKNLNGQFVDWTTISNEDNWPTEEILSKDNNFIDLVKKFKENNELAFTKFENIDLMKTIKIGSDHTPSVTNFRLILVFLQHTSYHLGQIVSTRKILGDWKGE